jgi:hypothetical protein
MPWRVGEWSFGEESKPEVRAQIMVMGTWDSRMEMRV